MKRILIVMRFGVALTLGLLVVACGDNESKNEEATINTLVSKTDAELDNLEKIDRYIEFYHNQLLPLDALLDRYFSDFGTLETPKVVKEIHFDSMNFINFKQIEKMVNVDPQLIELDITVKHLLEETKMLNGYLIDAREYYNKKLFRNDKYKEANLLHKSILQHTQAFRESLMAFEMLLASENRKIVNFPKHK